MPRQSTPTSLFGKRLREARKRMGIAQDKLGVAIGMDESCSSARISRYETGTHEPPIATVEKIAIALNVPLPYFSVMMTAWLKYLPTMLLSMIIKRINY